MGGPSQSVQRYVGGRGHYASGVQSRVRQSRRVQTSRPTGRREGQVHRARSVGREKNHYGKGQGRGRIRGTHRTGRQEESWFHEIETYRRGQRYFQHCVQIGQQDLSQCRLASVESVRRRRRQDREGCEKERLELVELVVSRLSTT